MALFSTALLTAMLLQATVSKPQQSVQEVVSAVSKNVTDLQASLPDFLCEEKITSTTYRAGKVNDQKVVEAIWGVQKSTEHREILTIDGRPAKKNAKLPDLPVNVGGAFSYMIFVTFAPQYEAVHEYKLIEEPTQEGERVVQFETKKEQEKIRWMLGGALHAARDSGKAWIDSSSMQVARFERNLLNLPRGLTRYTVTLDQYPVSIGEKQFWLPRTFRTEIAERDARNTGAFVAEYRNCKKFTTEVLIRRQD